MNRSWLAASLIALSLVAGVSYANSLQGEMVWDDRPLISENPAIQDSSRLLEALGQDYFYSDAEPTRYGYYRPVSTISLAMTYWVAGSTAWPYHLTNLVLHLGCSFLVLALGLMLGLRRIGSLAGALLFSIHPIHVESICWISGRTDLLATFFGLSGLLVLWRAIKGWDDHRVLRRVALISAGTMLAVLAVLSKEVALAIPLCVVIFCRADPQRRSSWRRVAITLAPLLVLAAAYVALRLFAVPLPDPEFDRAGPVSRLSSAFGGVARYVWMFIWPHPQRPYMQVPFETSFFASAPIAGFLLGAAAIASWLTRHRPRLSGQAPSTGKGRKKRSGKGSSSPKKAVGRPLSGQGWPAAALAVSALICLLPVLNLIRVSSPADMGFTMAERFLYLPSVFLCLLAGRVFDRSRQLVEGRARLALTALGAASILMLGWVCHSRGSTWSDEITLFSRAVETAPEGALPHVLLAQAYRRAGMTDRADEEIQAAQRAYRRQHRRPPAALRVTEAGLHLGQGRLDRAAELLEADDVQALGSVAVARDLALVYRLQGRLDLAREQLERALEIAPREPQTWLQFTLLYIQVGDMEQAEMAARRARELAPGDPATLHASGLILRSQGDLEGAERAFRDALEAVDVESDEAGRLGLDLGVVLSEQGRHDEAILEIRRAVDASNGDLLAQLSLAVALLRAGRLEEGTELLEELSRDHPDDPMVTRQLERAQRARARSRGRGRSARRANSDEERERGRDEE